MIGKLSFAISDPVYFEVNWVFKVTELTNIKVVRGNTTNLPIVNVIYIKYID